MSQQYGQQSIPTKKQKANDSLYPTDEETQVNYQTEINPIVKKLGDFHRYHDPPSKIKKDAIAEQNARIEKLTELKKKTLQYESMAEMMEDTEKRQL